MKLAQFEFLKRTGSRTTPIVLLDDIFDKLDASRVEQIVKLVAGDSFGQIFVTDTNRDHLIKSYVRSKEIINSLKLMVELYLNVAMKRRKYEAE